MLQYRKRLASSTASVSLWWTRGTCRARQSCRGTSLILYRRVRQCRDGVSVRLAAGGCRWEVTVWRDIILGELVLSQWVITGEILQTDRKINHPSSQQPQFWDHIYWVLLFCSIFGHYFFMHVGTAEAHLMCSSGCGDSGSGGDVGVHAGRSEAGTWSVYKQ